LKVVWKQELKVPKGWMMEHCLLKSTKIY
jgi:uncharacterized protein YbdZ (MbtH family)